jgi:hypothetical protein
MDKYRIPQDLLLQAVKDETVILDPNSGNYFTLDAIGTRMLQLFRETKDIRSTAAQIAAEYEVTPEIAQHDLVQLLDQMVEHGLAEAPDH